MSRVDPKHSDRMTGIVFDAVGTLIYPTPSVVDVYQRIGSRLGSALGADQIESRFREAFRRHFNAPSIGLSTFANKLSAQTAREQADTVAAFRIPDLPASEKDDREKWHSVVSETLFGSDSHFDAAGKREAFEQLWLHFSQPNSWAFYPDAEEALLYWSEQEAIRIAIASNFDSRLRAILCGKRETANLLETGALSLFISTELGFSKPSPTFFEKVASQLELEPTQLYIVGDNETADCVGGLAAGWNIAWLQRDASCQTQIGSERIQVINTLAEMRVSHQ